MNQLIHCINCHDIYLKTPFDQTPEYAWEPSASPQEPQGFPKDDFQDFLKNHRGHQLEDLKIIDDSFVSEKPYAEPVKISYFKATNGRETFVVKRFREKIDQPLRYQLIRGDYSLKCLSLQIQSEAIRKQLEKEINPPLTQPQIDAFLQFYEHVVKKLDVNTLERVPEESRCPIEIYYKMDDFSLMYLLRNCRNFFQRKTFSEIEAFIHRHREDGPLLLKAIYRIEISERREPMRTEVATVSLMRKVFEKV
ncbi:MAG: hypothetical protein ACUVWO_01890 [Thermodesulfobacteriota bacterium]